MKEKIFSLITLLVKYDLSVIEMPTLNRLFIYTNLDLGGIGSGSVSIDSLKFKGLDVTEFLMLDRYNENETFFISEFKKFVEARDFIWIRFNKHESFFCYTKA